MSNPTPHDIPAVLAHLDEGHTAAESAAAFGVLDKTGRPDAGKVRMWASRRRQADPNAPPPRESQARASTLVSIPMPRPAPPPDPNAIPPEDVPPGDAPPEKFRHVRAKIGPEAKNELRLIAKGLAHGLARDALLSAATNSDGQPKYRVDGRDIAHRVSALRQIYDMAPGLTAFDDATGDGAARAAEDAVALDVAVTEALDRASTG